MPQLEPLRTATEGATPEELLRYLITERFPGKTVVTASLRAPSIAVLKMVADIDATTPVVFCRRGSPFPESAAYHDTIVDLLRLTSVTVTSGREQSAVRGDHEHVEQMRVEYANAPGAAHEVAHLNEVLAPYDCWISAVYHVVRPADSGVVIDAEGRLYRVNPLAGWSDAQVREFLERHGIPRHARAYRRRMQLPPDEGAAPVETYNV